MTIESVIHYSAPMLSSFILAVLLTPLVRRTALKKKVVDIPDEPRKVQAHPVPLLGGIAVGGACVASVLIFWSMGWVTDAKIGMQEVGGLMIGGLVLVFGGALDDAYRLKPFQQVWFPLIASLIAVVSGITVGYLTNPFEAGTGPYGRSLFYFPELLGAVFSFLWILGMTYTTKLLDGLDGLASGIGAIGAFIIFIVSLFWDVPLSGTSVLALVLAGSLIGFLMYNFHPAKIFLGEGGSLFIGFMLGCLSIISGAKIATALLIMGIPILDVAWVIVRRVFWERRSFALADRKHLHFRLLDAGLSHRQAVFVLWGFTAVFGTSSIFLQSRQKVAALAVVCVVMALLAAVMMRRQQRIERDQKSICK